MEESTTIFKSREYQASDVVTANMIDYAVDSSINKIAHQIDGLKRVQQRVLWTMRNYLDDVVDSTQLVADTKSIHTSGDSSVSEVITRMNQSFNMGVPLLEVKGNGGMYGGSGEAAQRYTKVFITDLAKDLFYNKIHMDTIPKKPTDHFNSLEPVYFIPKLPTALLFYILTIGTGAKSQLMPLNFNNVCELVKRASEYKEKYMYSTVSYKNLEHLFIPDVPINNAIRNPDTLLESYKQGYFNHPVALEGCVDILKDSIVIRTSPFGIPIANVKKMIFDECNNKNGQFKDNIKDFKDLTSEILEAKLVIYCKDPLNVFDGIRSRVLRYNSSISPLYNLISKRNTIVHLYPPQIIDDWYHERRNSIVGGIKHSLVETSKQLLAKSTLLMVHDNYDEIMSVIRDKSLTEPQIAHTLMKDYKVSYPRIEIILGMTNRMHMNTSKENLLKDIDNLKQRAKGLAENIDKADEIIYTDAEYLQKKYSKPRISKISTYKGYVKHKDNILQFDTVDEAVSILANFDNSKVYTYKSPKTTKRCIYSNKKADTINPSRINKGIAILEYYNKDSLYLWLNDKKNYITQGELNKLDANLVDGGVHITNTFLGITKQGNVVKLHSSEHSKSRKKTELSDLLYALPNEPNLVVVYMNTKENNVLYFSKVDINSPKIYMNKSGTTVFLGYINPKYGEDILMNMPSFAYNNYKYLRVKNIKTLMGDNRVVSTTFTRTSPRNSIVRSMLEV